MSSARIPRRRSAQRISTARLDELIEEGTVDCYNESEQITGLLSMIDSNLELPFETDVLGMRVTVASVDLSSTETIVAKCRRGRMRQVIPILDLPLPDPPPAGAEWIEAYRRWVGRGQGHAE